MSCAKHGTPAGARCEPCAEVSRILQQNERLRQAAIHALTAIESSSATEYGDVEKLRADDRGLWVEAVEALRKVLGRTP